MIRTTVVGSWPIPFGLKQRFTDYYKGASSDEEAREVLQAAARISMDEHALLAEIPESMEVIAGIADVKSRPESEEGLRRRVEALLAVLPADRLLVSSSCGCGRVPHDDAIELMSNLVRAAHSF